MDSRSMSKRSVEASALGEGTRQSHESLEDWIAREALAFSIDSSETFNSAVDKMITSLGDSMKLLGLRGAPRR